MVQNTQWGVTAETHTRAMAVISAHIRTARTTHHVDNDPSTRRKIIIFKLYLYDYVAF